MASIIENRILSMVDNSQSIGRVDSRKIALLEVAYRLYVRRVFTLCLRLLASVQEAEEATVSVFARLSRELTHRWDESAIASRLRELAIGEALRRLWRNRERPREDRAIFVGTVPAKSNPSSGKPGSDAEARLLEPAMINELIAKLPNDLRIGFVLHDMEGLSYTDIGKHLNSGAPEVRTLVNRARLELRRLWLSPS